MRSRLMPINRHADADTADRALVGALDRGAIAKDRQLVLFAVFRLATLCGQVEFLS